MKYLTVIGGGISGLTCAIYAQRSGFQTTILEKASSPGGVSTSWKRKGYTFEGGIHWLIGAKKGVPLHDIWTETGALQDNNPVFFKDPVYTLIDDEGQMELRRDLRSLVKYAPEDRIALALLRFHVWCFTYFHSPIQDLFGLKVRHPRKFSPMEFIKMLPAVLLTPFLMCFSAGTYIKRFKNRRLRTLLEAVVEPRINALSFIYTLSTFTSGDSGYPRGGSLKMAQNMADTFTSLGGRILYCTPALEVTEEGVRTALGLIKSDAVVISMDARTAIDKIFSPALNTSWANNMRKNLLTTQCMFIALGVNADLQAWPRSMQVKLQKPLCAGGLEFKAITVNNYAGSTTGYAPMGHSVLTTILTGVSYDYWKAAKANGNYAQLKQEVIGALIERLTEILPFTAQQVETTDMATPLTYQRYCDTHEGSYMSEWVPRSFTSTAPIRHRKGLYFTGQRTSFSGGLPIAAETGRRAAQTLCRDFGTEFISR